MWEDGDFDFQGDGALNLFTFILQLFQDLFIIKIYKNITEGGTKVQKCKILAKFHSLQCSIKMKEQDEWRLIMLVKNLINKSTKFKSFASQMALLNIFPIIISRIIYISSIFQYKCFDQNFLFFIYNSHIQANIKESIMQTLSINQCIDYIYHYLIQNEKDKTKAMLIRKRLKNMEMAIHKYLMEEEENLRESFEQEHKNQLNHNIRYNDEYNMSMRSNEDQAMVMTSLQVIQNERQSAKFLPLVHQNPNNQSNINIRSFNESAINSMQQNSLVNELAQMIHSISLQANPLYHSKIQIGSICYAESIQIESLQNYHWREEVGFINREVQDQYANIRVNKFSITGHNNEEQINRVSYIPQLVLSTNEKRRNEVSLRQQRQIDGNKKLDIDKLIQMLRLSIQNEKLKRKSIKNQGIPPGSPTTFKQVLTFQHEFLTRPIREDSSQSQQQAEQLYDMDKQNVILNQIKQQNKYNIKRDQKIPQKQRQRKGFHDQNNSYIPYTDMNQKKKKKLGQQSGGINIYSKHTAKKPQNLSQNNQNKRRSRIFKSNDTRIIPHTQYM